MNLSLLEEDLRDLASRDLLRRLRILQPLPGAAAEWKGKRLTLFCGNDYLGLSRHPSVLEAVKKTLDRYGVGAGASRLISGTWDLHERAEQALAGLKNKAKALLFSSGYSANLGILSALAGSGDLLVLDKLCHASLIDGARLSGATVRVFPHKNYDRLETLLARLRPAHPKSRCLIVTDTVFSMDGDRADLKRLVEIKERFGAWLVADDAHGTGVLGQTGRGAAEDEGLESQIEILMGTTSKALGCLGGFAAASGTVIDFLVNHARSFIYSTALPPLLCAAIETGVRLIREGSGMRSKLWQNVQSFHEGLCRLGLSSGPPESPIFPILAGEEKKAVRLSQALLERGFLVPAVRTPTVPKNKARLRITLSALHGETEVLGLLEALQKII